MIRNLLFVGCLMIVSVSYAQNVTITSQADIDAFNYTEVSNLTIDGTDLEVISGFESLITINGYLNIINNKNLTSISGFDLLNVIGSGSSNSSHYIFIDNNPELNAINGFGSLETINGSFIITNNPKLVEISSFTNLYQVKYNYTIQNNERLTTISGFDKLYKVDGRYNIIANASLQNLLGFADLEGVSGFYVYNNNDMISIEGFDKLETVNSVFEIYNNSSLSSISGFDFLNVIGSGSSNSSHYIFIDNNPELNAINGFDSLETINGSFIITNNPKLIEISSFTNLYQVKYNYTIQNNERLTTISGFDKLYKVDGNFKIDNNPSLCSIFGLKDIERIGSGFSLTRNPSLDNCCIFNCINIEEIVSSLDKINIENNNIGCQSLNEITSSCTNFTCTKDCTETVDDCGVCGGDGPQTFYEDIDGDGMGNPEVSITSCCEVNGYVTDSSDTDDCPGQIDECGVCEGDGIPTGFCDCNSTTPKTTYYVDMDGDGFGVLGNEITACSQPNGYALVSTDLDDNNPNITDVVSIDEIENTSIQIHPNPTKGLLQINCQNLTLQNLNIQLINLQGQVMFKENQNIQNTQTHLIDIKHLPKGIYLLQITSQQLNFRQKLLLTE